MAQWRITFPSVRHRITGWGSTRGISIGACRRTTEGIPAIHASRGTCVSAPVTTAIAISPITITAASSIATACTISAFEGVIARTAGEGIVASVTGQSVGCRVPRDRIVVTVARTINRRGT